MIRFGKKSGANPMGQIYLRIWNVGDPLGVVSLFSPDCVFEDVHEGTSYRGHDGIRLRLGRIKRTLPDLHYTYRAGFTNFDRYAIEWAASATFDDAPFVMRGTSIGLLNGVGLIQENREYWDPVVVRPQRAQGQTSYLPADSTVTVTTQTMKKGA